MCGGLSIEINIWELFPDHIIQLILSKLPSVNLPLCRLVSKAWNHLILDNASDLFKSYLVFKEYGFLSSLGIKFSDDMPHKMHCLDLDAKYSQGMNVVASFRFKDVIILNSCNGLLCIINTMSYSRACVGILNPMTNEYINLPGYEACKVPDHFFIPYAFGFGFSSKTMHYKVARISFLTNKFDCSAIEIFTLGKSSTWSYGVSYLPFVLWNEGVYLNGALYWVLYRASDDLRRNDVCRLDVENENFEIISLPKEASFASIGVLNGNFYTTFWVREYSKFEVWTMQSYGGAENSWRKEFVVDGIPNKSRFFKDIPKNWGILRLIKVGENGEILCQLDKSCLYWYNPKTGETKTLIQDNPNKMNFGIYQIDSPNFDSLQKLFIKGG